MLKEVVLMESQMGLSSKKKMQTLIIDDMTSTNDTCLSNTAGMCLNTRVLSQKELIQKASEASDNIRLHSGSSKS